MWSISVNCQLPLYKLQSNKTFNILNFEVLDISIINCSIHTQLVFFETLNLHENYAVDLAYLKLKTKLLNSDFFRNVKDLGG